MPDVAGTIIEGTLGAAKAVESLVNAGKAKREAEQLKRTRPKLGRDVLADQNLALTKSELANGMSARAEKAYTDSSDRDISTSLATILRGGGDVNSVGAVYGKGEQGRENLAIIQDQLRMQQIQNEINTSKAVSERNDQQFQFNQWMPWADDARANAEARKGAEAGIWSGLQTVGAAGMQYSQQKNEASNYDKYFGVPKSRSISTDGVSRLPMPEIDRPTPTAQTAQLPTTLENNNQYVGTENEQFYNYLFNRKI